MLGREERVNSTETNLFTFIGGHKYIYEDGTELMAEGIRKETPPSPPKKRSSEKIKHVCTSVGVWCVANCGGVSNVCVMCKVTLHN